MRCAPETNSYNPVFHKRPLRFLRLKYRYKTGADCACFCVRNAVLFHNHFAVFVNGDGHAVFDVV